MRVQSVARAPCPDGHRPVQRACLMVLASIMGIAVSPASAAPPSTVLAYAGILTLDRGLDTRVYQGAFADIYTGDLGLHADVVHVDREEDATYIAGGLSYALTPAVRPKLMIGTSTANRAILPDTFVGLSIEVKPGINSGWVITPGVAYRHYRNGVSETSTSLAVARYFDLPWDGHGYYVAQASIATTFGANHRAHAAVTGGIQTVRHGGWAFGLMAEGGALVRDPIAGSTASGSYFALRPNLSFPVAHGIDVIARGEYSQTSLYKATGVTTGLKVGL